MARITPQEAIARLRPSPKRGRLMAPSNNNIQLEYNGTLGDKELLYVIDNNTEGKSYLCPADDQLNPIIVEFNGMVDASEEQPIFIQNLITSYENQIEQLSENDEIQTSSFNLPENSLDEVEPLIKTKWFQSWPHNCKFPYIDIPNTEESYDLSDYIINEGKRIVPVHAVAGCVNVALAQHFYYFWNKFKIPLKIKAKTKSTCEIRLYKRQLNNSTGKYEYVKYKTVSNYPWNISIPQSNNIFSEKVFKDTYIDHEVSFNKEEGPKDKYDEDISELLAYLAIIGEAYYEFKIGRNSSSNKINVINRAGQTYTSKIFNIINAADYIDKSKYTGIRTLSTDYNKLCTYLVEELNKGFPSIIDFDPDTGTKGYGHTINCDGYKIVGEDVYFHLNIGWKNSALNTYYPLTLINPNNDNNLKATTKLRIITPVPKDGVIIDDEEIDDTLYGDVNRDGVKDSNDVIDAVKLVYNGQYVKEGDIDEDNIFSEQDIEGVYDKCQEHSDLATKINYVYKIKRLTNNIASNLQDISNNLKQK